MLEKQLLNEFEEFSERRLLNEYNVENEKVWESFYLSSCGDEFFREHEKIREIIKNTNPKRYKNNSIFIMNSDFYENTLDFYNNRIDKENDLNLIHFGVCRINKIPFLSTKIELKESFSTHTDFHAMLYSEQMLNYKVEYIWVIFKWVRIEKTNEIL